MPYGFFSVDGPIFLIVLLVILSFRVLCEYERGVVFLLGRLQRVEGPGLVLIVPVIQQMMRVDPRMVMTDVPPQDVISHDNVSTKVNVVVYFRAVDPERVIIQVANYLEATSQFAQTTLRVILSKHELDEMLAEHEKFNLDTQKVLNIQTDPWGIRIANVETKHVDLNGLMTRATARQAEAKRERCVKVIHAEGELQASGKSLKAARTLAQQPEAIQLCYLQTLTQIAGDKSSTIVFPLPTEVLGVVKKVAGG